MTGVWDTLGVWPGRELSAAQQANAALLSTEVREEVVSAVVASDPETAMVLFLNQGVAGGIAVLPLRRLRGRLYGSLQGTVGFDIA
jgi:hypothetical protein